MSAEDENTWLKLGAKVASINNYRDVEVVTVDRFTATQIVTSNRNGMVSRFRRDTLKRIGESSLSPRKLRPLSDPRVIGLLLANRIRRLEYDLGQVFKDNHGRGLQNMETLTTDRVIEMVEVLTAAFKMSVARIRRGGQDA